MDKIKKMYNSPLFLLIYLGLIIRLLFSFLTGFKIDVDAWFAWALRANDLGLQNFYSKDVWTNYTPGYIYVLYLLGFIKNALDLPDGFFYQILKLPAIIAELILGAFIFKLAAKKYSIKISALISALVFFNPAFIFNSSVWGQIDGLLALLMVLSIYYLKQGSLMMSSVYLALSLLVKPQTISIFPAIGLYFFKHMDPRKLLQLGMPFLLILLILSLPFFPNNPIFGLPSLIIQMSQDYHANSLFALNFWGIFGFWIDDINTFANLSLRNWGIILFALYWIGIAIVYFKKGLGYFELAALGAMSFYFLPTRVHDRYLYPAIPFLLLTAIYLRSRIILYLTAAMSLLHFINLYYVYIYYNVFYSQQQSILFWDYLYRFLDKGGMKILSALNTIIFMFLSLLIVKISKDRPYHEEH